MALQLAFDGAFPRQMSMSVCGKLCVQAADEIYARALRLAPSWRQRDAKIGPLPKSVSLLSSTAD